MLSRPPSVDALLDLAKSTAAAAGRALALGKRSELAAHEFSEQDAREVKSLADRVLDEHVVRGLAGSGVPVLSEESGSFGPAVKSGLRFIVDPLDGTFNYVRGLGPCSVSIGLWEGDAAVFGALWSVDEGALYWGGRGRGAFRDGVPLRVSSTAEMGRAALCTGFPARLDLDDPAVREDFWRRSSRFAKVRMVGAATASLLKVAAGAADAYWERDIMIWDVAAGLALVEGAGGAVAVRPGRGEHRLIVEAWNGRLEWR